MKCRHMTCYQCEDAELVSLREEYEIMREDNARLTKERDEAHSLLQEIEVGPDYTACDYRDERANVRIYWIDSIRNKARLLLGKSTNSS